MDLNTRIRRRQRTGDSGSLVLDPEAISPIAHVADPVGREAVLGRLFEYLDPVFDGDRPPNAYVWGPPGTGKSAIVTALFTKLQQQFAQPGSVIHTATTGRSQDGDTARFRYVDTRSAGTEFGLYHTILDTLIEETPPRRGVGTDRLKERIEATLASTPGAVVAVDHVGEPETHSLSTVATLLDEVAAPLSWVAVGRTPPTALADVPADCIEMPPYRQQTLGEILMSRASEGLGGQAIQYEQLTEITDWADGNAHTALAALFGAANRAAATGRVRIHDDDLTEAMWRIPRPSVSLARVLTLPPNRQRVLRALTSVEADARTSVASAAEAIAATATVELSAGTVTRYLYELAETGVIERVRGSTGGETSGRPPSSVEPRFPPAVFEHLSTAVEPP